MTEFATQSIQDVAAAHGRPESSRFCLLDMQDQTTELVHPELSRVLQARVGYAASCTKYLARRVGHSSKHIIYAVPRSRSFAKVRCLSRKVDGTKVRKHDRIIYIKKKKHQPQGTVPRFIREGALQRVCNAIGERLRHRSWRKE